MRQLQWIKIGWLVLALLLSLTGCGRTEKRQAGAAPVARTAAGEDARMNWSDEDRDGIPDGAELVSENDRSSFRQWLTGIAELQYYRMSAAWNEEQRDCAGLVRFAWREALRRHDRAWFQAMNRDGDYPVMAPDVRAFTLDRYPLGAKLFRTDFGVFAPDDLAAGRFAEFADARSLKNYNTRSIGREVELARPGDLIFYHQPWVQRYPYHVMIFLGQARFDGGGHGDWVVYHTGGSATDRGEIRKVRLAMLRRHPDRRWHPVANNRHFLGYHRLKILD